jgi:SAM-dependent methyltransferase
MNNKTISNKENPQSFIVRRQYIEVPLPIECGMVHKLWRGLLGILLLPGYVVAAKILRTPGISIHIQCVFLAVRLFILRRISFRTFYMFVCFPMDSTRYFEFHEVLNRFKYISFSSCLDVSSPRLIPLMLLLKNRAAIVNIINPDRTDIMETEQLADALKLTNRCIFKNSTIEMAKYSPETFDLITCISVLEHIPADREAVEAMWLLLRPGGRLILTLPCMAQPLEQYISRNDYNVLSPGSDGYTFWQRYYDKERLQESIFNIVGIPIKMVVYGERRQGLFYRNANMKRMLGSLYPFWRESYMMAKEYRYFDTVAELPGEGVVMLEFVKT